MSAFNSARSAKNLYKHKLHYKSLLSSTVLLGTGLLLGSLQVHAADAPDAPVDNSNDKATTDNTVNAEETTDLGKVVVRSRNRLEPLKDVPLSISVVTGKELERLNATDIKDVLQRSGNAQWNQGNQRTSSLSIRGVGKIGQTEAQDPSVTVNVDGVSYAYNALTSSYDFVDIDSLEVTRGPQGTLLGKASSVGVIAINTRRPSFTPDAEYSVTFGQRDYLKAWAAGGGAVIDDLLAWRGTISFTKSDGYLTNLYNRDDTYTNKNRASGRVQFLLTPTENLNVRLILEKTPRAGETTNGVTIKTPTPTTYANGAANATTNESRLNRSWFAQQSSFTVNGTYLYGAGSDYVDYSTQRGVVTGSNGVTLEVDQHLDSGDITSISAYRDFHFNAVNDTGVPFDVTRNNGGFNNDYKQWSQELRFNSKIGEVVDYQAGLYYLKVLNYALYQRVFGNDAGAWFASNAQYTSLSANASGLYLLRNSLAGLSLAFNSPTGQQLIENESKAIFAQANWHLTPALTLTTGLRFSNEDRENTGSSFIRDNGSGAELNPTVINGVPTGGFDSYYNASTTDAVYVLNGVLLQGPTASTTPGATQVAAGGYALTTDTTQPALVAAANAQADFSAQKYFGISTWNALSGAQKRQLYYAQAIRKGQIGTLFYSTKADPFKQTLKSFVFSPAYKISDKVSVFASWQYGEKAGIAQFLSANSNPVKAEKTSDFEAGFKSLLLDHKLTFNATAYLVNIKDYQQSLSVLNDAQTAATGVPTYVTTTGNAPKLQIKGIEIDTVYVGIPYTSLRLSGSYNDAKYKEFPNAPQPVENGNLTGNAALNNVSGQSLAGAPKWSGNLGADFRIPVSTRFEFHSSANLVYSGKFNSDASLSSYAWVDGSTLADVAVGIGRRDQRFDVSVLVKNVFNDKTPLLQTWNTITPSAPRWWYLQFSGKL